MFKIIYSHLKTQVVSKPSVVSKFNKWSIAKSDLNISRFESVLFNYKKELLSTKTNSRRIIKYKTSFLIDTIFWILLVSQVIYLFIKVLWLFFITTNKFGVLVATVSSLNFVILHPVTISLIVLTIVYILSYSLIIKK